MQQRPTIITVGSGKGGVGKSFVSSNLAATFSQVYKKVVLIDLDLGCPDLAIMFGMFNLPCSLDDYVEQKVDTLEDLLINVPGYKNLHLIAGTSRSFKTANISPTTKNRLIASIQDMDADIIIVDTSPGVSAHTLDFFNMSDFPICVTDSNNASVMDTYKFLKMAVLRKAIVSFPARSQVHQELSNTEILKMSQLYDIAGKYDKDNRWKLKKIIRRINPSIVFNRIFEKSSSLVRLQSLLRRFLQVGSLNILGEIETSKDVYNSMKNYQPVVQFNPNCPASEVINSIMMQLDERIKY